jgi:hypothetical protein
MKTAKPVRNAREKPESGKRFSSVLERATVPLAVFLVVVGFLVSIVWTSVFETRDGKEYRGSEARDKAVLLLAEHKLTGEVLDDVMGVRSTGGKDTAWYYAFRVKTESFEDVRTALLEGRPSMGAVKVEEVEAFSFQLHWVNAPEWWCPRDDPRAILHKVGYNVWDGVPSSGIDLAFIEETGMVYVYRWSM